MNMGPRSIYRCEFVECFTLKR